MKLKIITYALLSVILFWISFPLLFYYLNDFLNLPFHDLFFMKILGVIFLFIDFIVFSYCSALFIKFGKGTPVPIYSPKKIVETSLYKYSRNPIYLGHIFGFFGIAFISGRLLNYLYVILAFFIIHLIVIYFEEPHLKRKFRKSYENYRKRVRRWI